MTSEKVRATLGPIGLLGILAAPPTLSAQATTHEAAQVARLVALYDSAWNRRDTTAVRRLMAPGYQYFSSVGEAQGRDSTLHFLGDPRYTLTDARRSEVAVTVSGPVAVVGSRWQGTGTWRGERFSDDQRCGQVWQRTGGEWKLLHEHCVQIVPRQGAAPD